MADSNSNILTSTMKRASGFVTKKLRGDGVTIPVVRLHGTISAEQRPNRINIEMVNPILEKAFAIKSAPAVAIVINSPGGSAVQSRLVSKRIRELATKHEKQVFVFVEDVAASGGYFIAVAGDEIYADPSSIVGSIGVIMATFGFEEAIKKIGVERRIYTAGKNKSTLDPFMPEKQEDVDRIKMFETDIHQVFIDWVKSHREGKITAGDDDIFTGEWWTGERAVNLGLIDGLGDVYEVTREKFGDKVKLKWIEKRKSMFPSLPFGLGSSISQQGVANDLVAAIDDKALWSRFGL